MKITHNMLHLTGAVPKIRYPRANIIDYYTGNTVTTN